MQDSQIELINKITWRVYLKMKISGLPLLFSSSFPEIEPVSLDGTHSLYLYNSSLPHLKEDCIPAEPQGKPVYPYSYR